MKSRSLIFLKVLLILIAVTTLAGMIRFPQTEGVAANRDLVSIYTDPFIIYLYIASIPFFIGLSQAYALLGQAEKKQFFSSTSVKAFEKMKYSAVALIFFLIAAISYVFTLQKATNDDGTGAMMVGMLTIVASGVVAGAAAVFQKKIQKVVTRKSKKK